MNRSRFVTAMMVAGFLFLYLPIVLMIAFSFNASRLVTVWGGFSTKWYGELVRNEQVLSAAWLSFKIAAMNATGATILGTLAGLSLARFGNFRGRPRGHVASIEMALRAESAPRAEAGAGSTGPGTPGEESNP